MTNGREHCSDSLLLHMNMSAPGNAKKAFNVRDSSKKFSRYRCLTNNNSIPFLHIFFVKHLKFPLFLISLMSDSVECPFHMYSLLKYCTFLTGWHDLPKSLLILYFDRQTRTVSHPTHCFSFSIVPS